MMTRLATRAPAGLDEVFKHVQGEADSDQAMVKSEIAPDTDRPSLAIQIRQILYMYIVDNFRPRLNVAISWLNEEWYADKLHAEIDDRYENLPNYYSWTTKLLDNLLPYLDVKDSKLLIRFMSEIPAINGDILDRVKSLARDPERVSMCMVALQYLLMFRPPIRSLVIETVASLWRDSDFSEAKSAASKVLSKWKPEVLKEEQKGDAMDGVKKEDGTADEERKEDYADIKAQMNGLKSPVSKTERGSFEPRKRVGSRTPTVAVGGETG
jgi:symplekin